MTFSSEMDDPVLGVDASTVSRDYGEVSTVLARCCEFDRRRSPASLFLSSYLRNFSGDFQQSRWLHQGCPRTSSLFDSKPSLTLGNV